MKRLLLFLAILSVLFAMYFVLSFLFFPSWLEQSVWQSRLTILVLSGGLALIGEEILSRVFSLLFEDKELNEKLLFIVVHPKTWTDILNKINCSRGVPNVEETQFQCRVRSPVALT
jgi:hypothetical protein